MTSLEKLLNRVNQANVPKKYGEVIRQKFEDEYKRQEVLRIA